MPSGKKAALTKMAFFHAKFRKCSLPGCYLRSLHLSKYLWFIHIFVILAVVFDVVLAECLDGGDYFMNLVLDFVDDGQIPGERV